MNFEIEFSDLHFRLVLIEPNGSKEFLEAVPYCSVSSACGSDGIVYGVYLTGSEPELDQLSSHPTNTELVSQFIKVYRLEGWPTLQPAQATITLIEAAFAEEEDADGDGGDDESNTIEVTPVS